MVPYSRAAGATTPVLISETYNTSNCGLELEPKIQLPALWTTFSVDLTIKRQGCSLSVHPAPAVVPKVRQCGAQRPDAVPLPQCCLDPLHFSRPQHNLGEDRGKS